MRATTLTCAIANVPPYQTLLIADALIKANKDFDLLLLPNQNHGYGSASIGEDGVLMTA